ncbi:cytochrome B [Thermofilum adornatum]|uniref:Cytochrome B n=2 Tax=Thermofilum adornatum TaxID=1365176 RepID=S5ZDV0_9CREN|nr:nickel-dependent hydrogenase large subunit [Thermofilum adornatum]AGT35218.1 cytochrome B [Thermofilum adornatum]AJB42930.1 NiFe hydrogenase, large subunit [Thermofilum adornatum 1505]
MSQKEIFIDPITRIEGHLALRALVDTATRKPSDVWVFATMFRGFEVFLRGRPPEDAIHITSRICGVCGASHTNASMHAVDMAYGVAPEPLGVVLRNMAFAMTDALYDHPLILNMLGGPDYSELIVKKLTPSVWDDAQKTDAPHRDIHGFAKISDIMSALNPVSGKIWQLTMKYSRIAREAGVLIYGRHSHPSTVVPGGITTDLTNAEYLLVGYTYRLTKLTAWAKFLYAVWQDLVWFYEERHGYRDQGLTYKKHNMVSGGLFDDPEAYSSLDGSPEDFYKNVDQAASKRGIKPGAFVNGELVTKSYKEINLSIMEHVERAFYEDWKGAMPIYTEKDPEGNPLLWGKYDVAYHPWNKTTIPKPTARDWNGKYNWAAHVRFVWKDGTITPFEVGPIARLTVTAYQPNNYGSGNGVLKVTLPRSGGADDLPASVVDEMDLEWRAPPYSTTLQRVLARAFNVVVDVASAWDNVVKAVELVRNGRVKTSRPWTAPSRRTFGVGFTEAPRGTVRHWVVQEGGKIVNYQIHAPTTGNVSPKDKWGMSPFEQSVANTIVTEEVSPDQWEGVDFVRAIRSFDPCIACAVHLQVGENKIIKKMIVR